MLLGARAASGLLLLGWHLRSRMHAKPLRQLVRRFRRWAVGASCALGHLVCQAEAHVAQNMLQQPYGFFVGFAGFGVGSLHRRPAHDPPTACTCEHQLANIENPQLPHG